MTCVWCVGEFGDLLAQPAQLEAGEQPLTITPADIVAQVLRMLQSASASPQVKQYSLVALLKLGGRFPDQASMVKATLQGMRDILNVEAQTRSCEFSRVLEHAEIAP